MSGSQLALLGGPFGGGYQIQRSLRFNSADSARLTRTFSSGGNRKTWTWSGWVKRTALSNDYSGSLLTCATGSTDATYNVLWFYQNTLRFQAYNTIWRETTAVYRDLSAWYHVVCAVDVTLATANNRIRLYVNGSEVTNFGLLTNPTQNVDLYINSANEHKIGEGDSVYSNMYFTEVNFIDGQQLTPSSFGETNADTGAWQPKQFTGTYGTTGFYLNFSDNSGTTSTTLGKDLSGNGNNWTPNNFSVTAGAGNDSLVDTPTPYGSDTGAGGEVRGNYGTWNPLWTHSSVTLANGNLQATGASTSNGLATGTIAISSGKWYWESTVLGGSSMWAAGIVKTTVATPNYSSLTTDSSYAWNDTGTKYNGQTGSSYGASSYTTNDVIGIAVDLDAGTVVFYKNGSSQGTAFTGVSGTFVPMVLCNNTASVATNFGQRPFAYTAPSGFKALVTQNLSTPTIVQPDDYFNTVLYTGNGNTGRSITGVGFQPDFVWNKARSAAYSNRLVDVLRGPSVLLNTDTTGAEFTDNQSITAFNTDGFTVGSSFDNTNSVTYVAWNWKANGAGVSNTQGLITSTVSANTTSGFSIVTWTASGTYPNTTIGHGIGIAPSFIITKRRDGTPSWRIWHRNMSTTNNEYYYLGFDTDAAGNFGSNYWVAPTTTTFGVQSSGFDNNTGSMVAYCFAPVNGFSAFGSYIGNGSIPGPFVYTGFRPAWILIKRVTTNGMDWVLYDNKRSPINVVKDWLYPNLANAEQVNDSFNHLDFVSNGFKVAPSGSVGNYNNTNGATYIYAAFAENPFKYSLAR